MNTETKSLFASKTLWGVLIAALPTVLGLFKLHITDVAAFTAGAQEIVDTVLTLSGLIFAAYGRVTATASLVVKTPPTTP
jgi:hypothetical protein